MIELDFSLATTEEILKELGKRAKEKRKREIDYFGSQKDFAKHIGMTSRRYQEFEISGKITLEKFIDVLRGLEVLEDIQELLNKKDEDFFNKKRDIKKTTFEKKDTKSSNDKQKNDTDVHIPNVFE
jgi:transcriptional regulator with XRE-family HTH domain